MGKTLVDKYTSEAVVCKSLDFCSNGKATELNQFRFLES